MILMLCGSFSWLCIYMNIDLSIKIIKEIQKNPSQSQRKLSKNCGVSLGSAHYCLKALAEKGYVKARNFKNSQNKVSSAYIWTPFAIRVQKDLTLSFLKRKQVEYEVLQREIQ